MMLTFNPNGLFPNQTNFVVVDQAIHSLVQQLNLEETSAETRKVIVHRLRILNEWIGYARRSPCLRTLVNIQPRILSTQDPTAPCALWKADLIVDNDLKRRRCFRLGTDDIFVKIRNIRDGLVLGSVDQYVVGRIQGNRLVPREPIEFFAVKNFMKNKIGSSQENMSRELTIQQRLTDLNNPFLLKLLAFMEIDDRFMALLPLIPKGDLFDNLSDDMSLRDIRNLMIPMIEGVRAIHALGICHRDISPENFLYQDSCTTVLMDFGLSIEMDENWQVQYTGFVGKKSYCPPELLVGCATYDGRKVDVWCLGVTFFVLITKAFPWSVALPMNLRQIMADFRTFLFKSFRSYATENLVDLMMWTLKMDPAQRPRADQLLEHPFFSDPL